VVPAYHDKRNPRTSMAILKQTKNLTEILREYGLDAATIKRGKKGLRYRHPIEKGVYWYWFARFVRLRDYILWGRCISCGEQKGYEDLQAGHYAPAGDCGMSLIFNPRNVNGECGGCNAFDEGHLFGYADGLDARYGQGTAQELKERYKQRHQSQDFHWTKDEYIEGITKMRENIKVLSTFLKDNNLAAARTVLQSMV